MLHNPAWLLITFQILSFKSYAVCKGLVPACRSKNKVAKDINMLESRRSVTLLMNLLPLFQRLRLPMNYPAAQNMHVNQI